MSGKRKNRKFNSELSNHSNKSKAKGIKVSGVLEQMGSLSKSEVLKMCGDAKSRYSEHPELIIQDVENIRRFQNEAGQRVLNYDLNTEDGFNQAVKLYKMLLGVA